METLQQIIQRKLRERRIQPKVETLQDIIQRKLRERRTGVKIPTPAIGYKLPPSPYGELPARQPIEQPTQRIAPAVEKPSILQRVGEYVTPQPEFRPIDVVRELPGAAKQIGLDKPITKLAWNVLKKTVGKLFESIDKGGAQIVSFISAPTEAYIELSTLGELEKNRLDPAAELRDFKKIFNTAKRIWGDRAIEIGHPLEEIFELEQPGKGMYALVEQPAREAAKAYYDDKGVEVTFESFPRILENKVNQISKLTGLAIMNILGNPFFLLNITGLYKGSFRLSKQQKALVLQGMLNTEKKSALEVLGLKDGATNQAIKIAYRKLAHKYHPDKAGGDETVFKTITAAYESLTKGRAFARPIVQPKPTPREAPIVAAPGIIGPPAVRPGIVAPLARPMLVPGRAITPEIAPIATGVTFQILDPAKAKQARALSNKLKKSLAQKEALMKTKEVTPAIVAEVKKLRTLIDTIETKLQATRREAVTISGPEARPSVIMRPVAKPAAPSVELARPEPITLEADKIISTMGITSEATKKLFIDAKKQYDRGQGLLWENYDKELEKIKSSIDVYDLGGALMPFSQNAIIVDYPGMDDADPKFGVPKIKHFIGHDLEKPIKLPPKKFIVMQDSLLYFPEIIKNGTLVNAIKDKGTIFIIDKAINIEKVIKEFEKQGSKVKVKTYFLADPKEIYSTYKRLSPAEFKEEYEVGDIDAVAILEINKLVRVVPEPVMPQIERIEPDKLTVKDATGEEGVMLSEEGGKDLELVFGLKGLEGINIPHHYEDVKNYLGHVQGYIKNNTFYLTELQSDIFQKRWADLDLSPDTKTLLTGLSKNWRELILQKLTSYLKEQNITKIEIPKYDKEVYYQNFIFIEKFLDTIDSLSPRIVENILRNSIPKNAKIIELIDTPEVKISGDITIKYKLDGKEKAVNKKMRDLINEIPRDLQEKYLPFARYPSTFYRRYTKEIPKILKKVEAKFLEPTFREKVAELQAERIRRPIAKAKPIERRISVTQKALAEKAEIKAEQRVMDKKYADIFKEEQKRIQKDLEVRMKAIKTKLIADKEVYAERMQVTMEKVEDETGRIAGYKIGQEIAKLKKDLKDYKTAGRDKQFFQDLDVKLFQEYVEGKSKWDKSEIVSQFIDDNFKLPERYDPSISLEVRIFPSLDKIEREANRAVEKFLRWAYKKTSGDKVAKMLQTALQKSKVINTLGKAVIYRYRLPEWYKKLKDLSEKKQMTAQTTANELMTYLSEGLTEEQKINLHGAIINHGISPDPDIAARATAARQMMDSFGQQFAEAGGIKMDTFLANQGKYLPRLYYTKELVNPLLKWTKSGGYKANLQRAKHRGIIKTIEATKLAAYEAKGWKKIADSSYKGYIKIRRDWTEAEKEAWGEIKDEPGYLVAKGITQLGYDTAVLDVFKQIVILHPEVISRTPVADFIQLPQTRSYGYLAGKYVDPYIYNDIKGTIEAKDIANEIGSRMLTEWKKFKIVDNPATYFRNMYFNFILSDIAGLRFYRADIYGPALLDVWNQTGDYKTTYNAGLFTTSFVSTELKNLLIKNKVINLKKGTDGTFEYSWDKKLGDNMMEFAGKIMSYYSKTQAKLGNVYQGIEEWNKMALYKYAKQDLGFSDADAVTFAKKWGLNYKAVTPWANKYSQKWYGIPFVRFKILAAPRLAEGFLFRPFTVLKWIAILAGIEEFSRRTLGLAVEELKQIKREIFPKWMQEGLYILAPGKDKEGNYQFLDLTYIIPYVEDLKAFNLLNYSFGNPFYRIPTEIIMNRSAYTGRDLVDKTLYPTLSSQMPFYLAHLYNIIMPPLAPFAPNFNNIYEAITQKEDYEGKTKDLMSQISTTIFGLKLRSIDITSEQRFRLLELQEKYNTIKGRIRSIFRHEGLSEEKKAKEIERLLKILEDVTNKALDVTGVSQTEEAAKLFR